ncbi:MAG: hypothetical protein P8J37_05430 [Fuerstiella sp.]|nr:hypothetical protein [Fuerstiella sp.]
MHKAIGFIACVSVMAASLYLFSGGDPSRVLSAQTESGSPDSYGSVARRFMNDARQSARQGDVRQARRLAETAASLSASWQPGEQTPQKFLAELDESGSRTDNPWDLDAAEAWPSPDSVEPETAAAANPFTAANAATEGTAPLSKDASIELINKHQAQKLMQESRKAMSAGNTAVARTRAMQARTLKVSWGLWDDRPDHLLAQIDRAEGTTTFFADDAASEGTTAANPQHAEQSYQKAKALVEQARSAIAVGRLQQASDLANQAEGLNASYGLFEDNPLLVRKDIAKLTEPGVAPTSVFHENTADGSTVSADEKNARGLVDEARRDLLQGRLAAARDKAEQAQSLNIAWSLLDDRPELILAEVEQTLAGTNSSRPGAFAPVTASEQPFPPTQDNSPADPAFANMASGFSDPASQEPVDVTPQQAPNPFSGENGFAAFGDSAPTESLPVVHPTGTSAEAAMQQGIALLRKGDHVAGRESLMQAWNNAGQLDAARRQTLQVILQQVSSNDGVALTSGSAPQEETTPPITIPGLDPMAETDPLESAANQLDVRITRLRTEVLNSVFRAEKLKEQNAAEALEILDRTLATVEAADLPEESVNVLASHVQRAQRNIRTYMEHRAPIIANEERNRNVKEEIRAQLDNQIRIEQEFADLNGQYNDLMRQRRYPEAELVATKARDLNPNLPQAVIMVEKARLRRQIDFNEQLREKKAAGFLDVMNDVELSAIPSAADYTLGKSWQELTKRRAKYGRADSRTRTESELRIEKSLREVISLHFHDVPLTDIIRHIATTHGINIALDTRAIETDGLLPNQAVSIDVDGIQLRSALNLLLDQAGGLVYDIENEVLKITNRLEKESKYEPIVYNVADLVVPVSLDRTPGAFDNPSMLGGNDFSGSGLFQVNDDLTVGIGSNGMPRRNGTSGRSNDRGIDFSNLIDLITTTVEPGTWDLDGGAGRAEGNENTLSLVIRQTPAVHDQIVDLLGQLRKLQDLQVTVEVRFVSVTDRFFERIGVDFDFNIQDNLGDPPGVPAFGSRQLQFPGGQAGGGGGGGQQGDLRGGQQGGGGGQQGGQQGQQGGATGLFDTIQRVNSPRDDFNGQAVGLASPDSFTEDYDIQFRQGSFELGVPDFGNFNPDAGIQVGMAILSDLEAFFFIQAAQADERANILFAPKVTLFNGQLATITDATTRPFVIGLIPVVGSGSVGFQPIIQPVSEGINLTVVAVISADRRFVRLSLAPQFNNIVDVFTFSFASGGAGGGAIGGGQQGGGGGQFGGGGGGGQFGQGGIGGGGGGGQGGQGGGQQGQQGGAAGGTLTVQQPVVEQISVSTTVSVPDGGTVLLGGIKRLREGRNMAGVPILNKIPYVSRLFKNSGVGRETESVMLMVTPRIIIHEEEEELVIGTSGL